MISLYNLKDSVVDPHTSRKDILSKAVKSGRFISYCAWLYYFVLFLKVKSWNMWVQVAILCVACINVSNI